MRNYRFILRLVLLAALLTACAPEASATMAPAPVIESPAAVIPTVTLAVPTLEPATELAATALPVATSRGPDLHATDPATVSLASGGLQFVEFFRFT
jgi:hypothetical protein